MFFLGSFRTWLEQLLLNKGGDPDYVQFTIIITLSRFLTILIRLYERIFSARAVKSAVMNQAPIFIIGHWRSGTTYLHNLLCHDKNMGYMTLLQAVAPEMMLFKGRLLGNWMTECIPAVRPMDNISLSPDAPQEEEFALANMASCSFYHQWVFPRRANYYFEKFALLQSLSPNSLSRWRKTYFRLVRKIFIQTGRRRLVLKNPANTGRVRELLALFPDAKFIHILRNPYDVFPSTRKLYKSMLSMFALQKITQEEIDHNVFTFYEKLIKKFWAEKDLIPPANLVEVRFENLTTDPLAQLRRIYGALNLPGFDAASSDFKQYIAAQAGYRKNTYALDRDTIKKISRRWRIFIEAWGYQPPGD